MNQNMLSEIVSRLEAHDRGELRARTDMDELQAGLAGAIGSPVTLRVAGEYEYSDRLEARFAASGTPAEKPAMPGMAAVYKLIARISEITPYATVEWAYTTNERFWSGCD